MPQDRTRKIVVSSVLGAISIILGVTHWGYIPWLTGIALTFGQLPVIIGAILEGPWVGLGIGFIFGVTSMIVAAVAPTGPGDVPFTNPLLSVLPRLFIGPVAWLIWSSLRRWNVLAIIVGGIGGSLTNTILVLGMYVILKLAPLYLALVVALLNGIPEAILAAMFSLAVVASWQRIPIGRRQGSNLGG